MTGQTMSIKPSPGVLAFQGAQLLWLGLMLWSGVMHAEAQSLSNLLAQADRHETNGQSQLALECLLAADRLSPTNCEILCRVTKQYCDLIFATASKDEQKKLADQALDAARRAVAADPKSAKAHLCVAVSYTKKYPFIDNATKVEYSRLLKAEAETAIALDPKQDVAYYMLGRWHHEVANMNFVQRGLVKIAYGGLPKASDEQAIQNFKKAIELAPNRIVHHAELARVYRATGEKKLARGELEKCRDLTPLDHDDADAQRDALKELARIGNSN